jgi:NAD(P)H-hydrate epimerase
VFSLSDPDQLNEVASSAFAEWKNIGEIQLLANGDVAPELDDYDLIVDALLGTGVDRDLADHWIAVVEEVNRAAVPVLAIDVPSGLNADTGNAHGIAVVADITITFVAKKFGLVTGYAADHVGELVFDPLDPAEQQRANAEPVAEEINLDDMRQWIRPRGRTNHKGQNGHLLIIGGNLGMSGAVRLAGESALRCGAGLVSIATHPAHAAEVDQGCPEVMALPVVDSEDFDEVADWASVIAIGPGLGQSEWAQYLFRASLKKAAKRGLPLVMDADALTMLAANPEYHQHWVLTPHPGEAARLLGCKSAEVQADRLAAANEIVKRYGGTVVLKGPGTVIASKDERAKVVTAGNFGMGIGGMGDVLTGVVGAMLADGLRPYDAACAAAVLHSSAGDIAAGDMPRGMLPSDLFNPLRRLVNFK